MIFLSLPVKPSFPLRTTTGSTLVAGGERACLWQVRESQRSWAQLHAGGHGRGRGRSSVGLCGGPEGVEGHSGARGGERVRPSASESGGAGVCEDAIPTTENIAIAIWRRLEGKIPNAKLHRVRVYEMPDLFADYYGEHADA